MIILEDPSCRAEGAVITKMPSIAAVIIVLLRYFLHSNLFQSITSSRAVSKPLEIANLIKNKFGSSENVSTVPAAPGSSKYQGEEML